MRRLAVTLLVTWGLSPTTSAFTFPIEKNLIQKSYSSNCDPSRQLPFRSRNHWVHKSSLPRRSTSNDNDGSNELKPGEEKWLLGLCFPLWLAYVSNQWSRSSIYYLVDFSDRGTVFKAMNLDLNFSQAQYGILASIAFTSLFAVASLIAGAASDRYNRKSLTIASAATWGVATLGTSLSNSYEEVVLWRILMGLSCAFSTPTAYTLIAERVPANKGALASSLYSTGIAVGGALASLSILLDTQIGWRDTALAISFFAFISTIINILLLEDDPKEERLTKESTSELDSKANDKSSDIGTDLGEVLASTRVQLLFLASFLRFCSGLLIGVWSAPYFRQIFPDNASDYAVAQAAITASCGIVSGLIGGALADRLKKGDDMDYIGRQLWIPVAGNLLAIPAWYMAITSVDSFQVAMVWLAIEYLVAECWFGPTISVLQSSVGPKAGGTAQGLFTVTGALGNLAPAALGFFYEQQNGGNSEELTRLLTITVCGCYVLSAICFSASALSTSETMD